MAPVILLSFLFDLILATSAARAPKISKLHHKSVRTVKTVYGDVYDCIDVYQQHSLTHPALRHHQVKMSATFPYERHRNKKDANVQFDYRDLWKSKRACPKGSVPVRRTNTLKDRKIVNASLKFSGGVDFAGIVTAKPGKRYYGVAAGLNLWNPTVFSDKQYSSAILSLEGGEGSNFNQILVGWTVNPILYGDRRTRLYTSWTNGSTVCFNTQCPGFIITSPAVPLDYAFKDSEISSKEGKQFEVRLNVTRNQYGWWLEVAETYFVGYWPLSLFTGLQYSADTIRMGGQVFTSTSDEYSPKMGSGVFKNGQFDRTAYVDLAMVIDESQQVIDVDNSFINEVDSRCYYAGDNSFKNDVMRYMFYFGGKGGKDQSTCVYKSHAYSRMVT